MRKPDNFNLNLHALAVISALLITGLILSGFSSVIAAPEAAALQWSNTYGPFGASAIIQTQDGGFALVGNTATFSFEHRGYSDFLPILVKINSLGELEWKKTLGTYLGQPTSVAQTSDSGFIINGNNWLVKTDAQGNVQWSKTTDASLVGAWGVKTSDGNFVLAGFANDQTTNLEKVMLLKYDENGTFIWEKKYDASVNRFASAIIQANDGNYVVAGNLGQSFWFAKIDTDGNLLLNQTYYYGNISQVSSPSLRSIASTKDKGYILAGTDGQYAWIVKTDSEGNEQWHQRYDYGYLGFSSVVQANDGGYVAFAETEVVKVDNFGNVQWSEFYNSTDNSSAPGSISNSPSGTHASWGILTIDGGFAVAGNIHIGGDYIWVAKFVLPSDTLSQTAIPSETISSSGVPSFPLGWIILPLILGVFAISLAVYLKKYKHKFA